MNDSINSFTNRVDNSILDSKGNTCGIIDITIIEITFGNDYIRVLYDLPNLYIYVYLISKLISAEATIHDRI